ncbi:MAG: class I SAM-dependent methyltransferase [Acidobacteriota bacterium]
MQDKAVEAAMRPVNYEIIFDVEDDHWWFVGRRAVVFAQIADALAPSTSQKRQILDIGCGTGATMDHLRKYGEVQGIDLAMIPLNFSRRRGHQRTMCASATQLPFGDESFDLVTTLDVIEHLDDDVKGLSEIRRVLKPGAPAVIYVPAFQALWGPTMINPGTNDDTGWRNCELPLKKQAYRLNESVTPISPCFCPSGWGASCSTSWGALNNLKIASITHCLTNY